MLPISDANLKRIAKFLGVMSNDLSQPIARVLGGLLQNSDQQKIAKYVTYGVAVLADEKLVANTPIQAFLKTVVTHLLPNIGQRLAEENYHGEPLSQKELKEFANIYHGADPDTQEKIRQRLTGFLRKEFSHHNGLKNFNDMLTSQRERLRAKRQERRR